MPTTHPESTRSIPTTTFSALFGGLEAEQPPRVAVGDFEAVRLADGSVVEPVGRLDHDVTSLGKGCDHPDTNRKVRRSGRGLCAAKHRARVTVTVDRHDLAIKLLNVLGEGMRPGPAFVNKRSVSAALFCVSRLKQQANT